MPPEKPKRKKILDHLNTVGKELSRKKYLNLFLDFDGTLVPIEESPDKVKLPHEVYSVLDKIRKYDNVFVAIITGRSFDNIKEIINLRGIHYAGNHGLEISGVKRTEIVPNASQVVRGIKKITDDLNKILITVPGAWVENKSLTASVHYRSVPASHIQELNRLVGEITSRYIERGLFRLKRGKKVIEIHPKLDWDRGKAIRWMQKNIAHKRATNIYIGDDEVDEYAFRAFNSAITVRVARDIRVKTEAQYYVNNPIEVRYFLQWVLERVAS